MLVASVISNKISDSNTQRHYLRLGKKIKRISIIFKPNTFNKNHKTNKFVSEVYYTFRWETYYLATVHMRTQKALLENKEPVKKMNSMILWNQLSLRKWKKIVYTVKRFVLENEVHMHWNNVCLA